MSTRTKSGSKTVFSEYQVDMREMDTLLPDVVVFNSALHTRSKQIPEEFIWTENGIEDLREKLLIESVRAILDSRCSQATWDDVTTWMCSDNDENPFSFVCCVTEVMNADPERYREAVFNLVRMRNPKMIDQIH